MRPHELIKPTIKLYYSAKINNSHVVEEILYGAEEEGIPVDVKEVEDGNAFRLAHQASMDSILETGIGVSDKGAVVKQKKLPINRPIYMVAIDAPLEDIRKVGANGARLVKRMPLKF